jgi:hypothetical protein
MRIKQMYIAFEPYSKLHKNAADKDLDKPKLPFNPGLLKGLMLPQIEIEPDTPEWKKLKEEMLKYYKNYQAAKEREARWEELYGQDPNYITRGFVPQGVMANASNQPYTEYLIKSLYGKDIANALITEANLINFVLAHWNKIPVIYQNMLREVATGDSEIDRQVRDLTILMAQNAEHYSELNRKAHEIYLRNPNAPELKELNKQIAQCIANHQKLKGQITDIKLKILEKRPKFD